MAVNPYAGLQSKMARPKADRSSVAAPSFQTPEQPGSLGAQIAKALAGGQVPGLPSFASFSGLAVPLAAAAAGLQNPAAPPAPAGVLPADAWGHYLSLVGAGQTGNPEAEPDWAMQQSGKYYRRKQRGFDLYGLAPQEAYWQNLYGSGLTYEDVWGADPSFDPNRPKTTIRPDEWWIDQTQGSTVMPGWLQSDLADLERAWPSMSDAEQQLFLDRMLTGAGLPSYLQEFQRTRPQFINDYITSTFVV